METTGGKPEKQPWRKRLRILMKVNRKLILLKILLLLMFGAMSALYPFMTIHMTSLGLSQSEVAFIYALLPFVSFVGPPIGGWLADRLGNYRLVFVVFALLCALTHSLIWYAVPSAITLESKNSMKYFRWDFECSATGRSTNIPSVLLNISRPCDVRPSTAAEIRILQCHTTCNRPQICFVNGDKDASRCSALTEMNGRTLQAVVGRNGVLPFIGNYSMAGDQWKTVKCQSQDGGCVTSCDAYATWLETCKVPNGNKTKTLVLYIVFRYLAGIAISTMSPILDAIAYQMAKEHHGDLGVQRAFTLIGMAAFPPLSGYLIDYSSKRNQMQDYSPAFLLFATMTTAGAIIAYFMTLQLKMPAENIMRHVRKILANPKVTMFIVMMFLTGCFWGFLENFLFVFMEEIRSPRWLMGMTATVSALSALPVVACSTLIMKFLGHTKIIAICAILYGIRFIGYSFTYDPFLILPIEILEAFTTSLLWVVASVYCGKVAPDYLATLQGIVSGAHAAIGRGVGSLVGGLMFEKLGKRPTYQLWGLVCIAIGSVYMLMHFLWLRKLKHTVPDNTKLSPDEEDELEKVAESTALNHVVGSHALTSAMSVENIHAHESHQKQSRENHL